MLFKEDYQNIIFALNVTIIKQRGIVRKAKADTTGMLGASLSFFEKKLEELEMTKLKIVQEKEKLDDSRF